MAFNASFDRNFCKYWTETVFEKEVQEFGTHLEQTLEGALQNFKNVNGMFPKQILIYRDGVG